MLENEKHKENLIGEVLKMEPSFNLPSDFVAKVTRKVSKRMVLQQYLNEFLVYFAVIVGIVGISAGIIFYFNSETWQSWINLAKSNLVLAGGIVFIALFILFSDKVLLRYFHYSVSTKGL